MDIGHKDAGCKIYPELGNFWLFIELTGSLRQIRKPINDVHVTNKLAKQCSKNHLFLSGSLNNIHLSHFVHHLHYIKCSR